MGSPATTTASLDDAPCKLKDSCTDCAASKVKCTREKPTCQRCARRGRPCEYAESKRSGRSSAKRNATFDIGPESNQAVDSHQKDAAQDAMAFTWTPESIIDIFNNNDQSAFNLSTWSEPPPPDLPSSSMPSWDDLTRLGNADYTDLSSFFAPLQEPSGRDLSTVTPSDMSQSNPFSDTSMDLTAHVPMHIDSAPTAPAAPAAPVAFMLPQEPNVVASGSAGEESQDHCLATATQTLLSLFPPKASPGGAVSLMLDTVLKKNQQAIEDVTTILACHCSKDQYLMSVLSLILLKIMAWYAAAARGADGSLASTSALDHSQSSQHRRFSGEAVPRESGAHEQGGRNGQDRRAAQVVMGELHKVQRTMRLLSSRLAERDLRQESTSSSQGSMSVSGSDVSSGCSCEENHVGASELSEGMFNRLDAEIHGRFRAVSGSIIERLRIS